MITVDLPVGGKRERDFRNDFGSRSASRARTCSTSHRGRAWALSMLRRGMPVMENLVGFTPEAIERRGGRLHRSAATTTRPSTGTG